MSQKQDNCDVVIIGAGPGGYVAAIRAVQLGLKPILIERDRIGGVCLNTGCIPSKSLIHQAGIFRSSESLADMGVGVDLGGFDYSRVQKRSRLAVTRLAKGIEYLLGKNNVEVVRAEARIDTHNSVVLPDGRKIFGGNILIATGSRPRELSGFPIDEERVVSSSGALEIKELPNRMLVLGSGAVGLEFAHIFSSFGVDVHVVEALSRILPNEDEDVSAILHKSFVKRGVSIHLSTTATSFERSNSGLTVCLKHGDNDGTEIDVDRVLVAVGRTPNTEGLGIEEAGCVLRDGFVQVDEYCRTAVAGVYAIGDVTDSPQLAHVASSEGEVAVEHMAGLESGGRMDIGHIPSVVYCEPEVGSFGLSEERAKAGGISYRTASFPYRGVGKSVTIDKPDGMVKIVYAPETRKILGAHVVGAEASELIHELLLAKRSDLLPDDVGSMMHAHPTLSEAVMEAARMVCGRAIHV